MNILVKDCFFYVFLNDTLDWMLYDHRQRFFQFSPAVVNWQCTLIHVTHSKRAANVMRSR